VLSGDRRAKYLNSYLPGVAEEVGHVLLVLETNGFVLKEELTDIQLTLVAEFSHSGNHSVIQLFSANKTPPEQ